MIYKDGTWVKFASRASTSTHFVHPICFDIRISKGNFWGDIYTRQTFVHAVYFGKHFYLLQYREFLEYKLSWFIFAS